MKEFKIESYKFSALCTLKSHLISLFPVEILLCHKNVLPPLLLTLAGWVQMNVPDFVSQRPSLDSSLNNRKTNVLIH